MIEYRAFRNGDPPGLVEVWNSAFIGRGAFPLRGPAVLDEHLFNKIYFDPKGLIVAVEDGYVLGFVHAGFGPDEAQAKLDKSTGVISAIAVKNGFLRLGIGTKLLEAAENYLKSNGATLILAGGMKPNNPFYFGLYGGSDSPGFLYSDAAAGPFFESKGYKQAARCIVIQRNLDEVISVADPRFTFLKRRFDFEVVPRMRPETWWKVCLWGEIEPVECQLVDKETKEVKARASYWEMTEFGQKWGTPAVGLLDLDVAEDMRGQGLGKYLLYQTLRHLQEQFFQTVEMQVVDGNLPALELFEKLGFDCVDEGYCFGKVIE